MKKIINGVLSLSLSVLSMSAGAASGAVDESGCHASAKIGWHCHPQRGKGGGLANGESQKQRDTRLNRECKGKQDAGMCSGHVKH